MIRPCTASKHRIDNIPVPEETGAQLSLRPVLSSWERLKLKT